MHPFLKTDTSPIPPVSPTRLTTLRKPSGLVGGSGDRRGWEGFRLIHG